MTNAQPPRIGLDELRSTWGVVAQQLEAFVSAWEAGQDVPRLADFAPAGSPQMRRIILIELVKADLEFRLLKRDIPRSLESYLEEFDELRDGGVPTDLLYDDFHLRKQRGEAISPEEYCRRFPDAATNLARLLGHDRSTRRSVSKGVTDLVAVDAGQTLDDFELLRLLGKGAFAKVFLGWQKSMHRMVAVKVSATLGNEPRTLAQLDHPHIVHVFDQRAVPDRGLSILYMTYVGGGTLQDVLDRVRNVPMEKRSGQLILDVIDSQLAASCVPKPADSAARLRLATLEWPLAVAWLGARLADALDYAHGQGVLHRDIKPANVLLTADGMPQLADFNVGACSKLDAGQEDSFFGGSIGYMSPEQLEAFNPTHPRQPESLDGRADLYSLGVTLWELLTGRRPFALDQIQADRVLSLIDLARDRSLGVPDSVVRKATESAPAELIEALVKSLHPTVDGRPARPRDLAVDLDRCLHPRSQNILRLAPTGILAFLRRWPFMAIIMLGLLPNAFASTLNVAYNHAAVISQQEDPAQVDAVFQILIPVINAFFFPVGFGIFIWLSTPVAIAVHRLSRGKPVPAEKVAPLRSANLLIPVKSTIVGVCCWGVAGVIWPIVLDVIVGTLAVSDHLHFVVSLIVCGVMAAVYSFFFIAWFALRGMLPVLWKASPPTASDLPALKRFRQCLLFHMGLAFGAPMTGVAILSFVQAQSDSAVLAMRWLSAAGVIGALLALALERKLQSDTEALEERVRG